MNMNTSEQILVIILASALALFLVLAIIIAAMVISLIKKVNDVASKAQELVTSAESTADILKNTVGQLSVLRFVHSIIGMVTKHKGNEKKGD
jgi:cell division protein FtsB